MSPLPTPPLEPGWIVYEPDEASGRELDVESNLTVANGRLGVRGSRFLRLPGRATIRRTYVAGFFVRSSDPPHTPCLAPLPFAAGVTLLIDGRPLPNRSGEGEDRVLDLRRGVLHAETPAGRGPIRMRGWRFASQDRRDLVVEILELTCTTDARVTISLADDPPPPELIRGSRRGGRGRRPHAHSTALVVNGAGKAVLPARSKDGALTWRWAAKAGETTVVERRLIVTPSTPRRRVPDARNMDARTLLDAHTTAWRRLWRDCDVRITGDADAQAALRFGAYHLNSAVNPGDESVSVAARGLTGDGYRGHVFWDTEIYMLPFYVLTRPEAARALLMYRYRTLPAARAKARRSGWKGAAYAWESADTGEEATPPVAMTPRGVVPIPTGQREQHISADVAYGVWTYWIGTGDDDFMWSAGAEILLETARFWASRALLESDGRYHIHAVEGPDEYHEKVDDNAFTNAMAALNLRQAADTATLLAVRNPGAWRRLARRLRIGRREVATWTPLAGALETGLSRRNAVIEQFEGFLALDDLVTGTTIGLPRSVGVLLGPRRLAASQVVKQADVVALLALRPELASREEGLATLRYYGARCDHDSSLSAPLHALLAARLGDLDTAMAYFEETAAVDRVDVELSSGAGVHMAAQGGLWQAAVLGFGGLSFDAERLSFDPRLPRHWRRLAYPVKWRGRRLRIVIDATAGCFRAALIQGQPLEIRVRGVGHRLGFDGHRRLTIPLP